MGRRIGRFQATLCVTLLCVTYLLAPLNTVVAVLAHESYHRLHGESGAHVHDAPSQTPESPRPAAQSHTSGSCVQTAHAPGTGDGHAHAQGPGTGDGHAHALGTGDGHTHAHGPGTADGHPHPRMMEGGSSRLHPPRPGTQIGRRPLPILDATRVHPNEAGRAPCHATTHGPSRLDVATSILVGTPRIASFAASRDHSHGELLGHLLSASASASAADAGEPQKSNVPQPTWDHSPPFSAGPAPEATAAASPNFLIRPTRERSSPPLRPPRPSC